LGIEYAGNFTFVIHNRQGGVVEEERICAREKVRAGETSMAAQTAKEKQQPSTKTPEI
jgi:hypothetical protein